MCPACLTSIALTVAAATGTGAAVTVLVVRVRRSNEPKRNLEMRKDRR